MRVVGHSVVLGGGGLWLVVHFILTMLPADDWRKRLVTEATYIYFSYALDGIFSSIVNFIILVNLHC